MTGSTHDPFFPPIRDAAEQTDQLSDDIKVSDSHDPSAGQDDRPMQEVESLCMACGEQVRADSCHLL